MLWDSREPTPLFVLIMQTPISHLAWLHRALSCSVHLLLICLHVFILR